MSATPDGPPAPAGGWSLEYADAFGSALKQAGGQDNTWYPSRYDSFGSGLSCTAGRGFNSNEMQNFTCDHATVNPSTGLDLRCSYGAPANAYHYSGGATINYDCGTVAQRQYDTPPGYDMFSWTDPYGTTGRTIVAQTVVQFPPNYDSDPAFWGTGSYVNQNGDEIDHFEGFGWGEAGNRTDCLNGNACAQTWQKQLITMPTVVNASGNRSEDASGQNLGFNPAAGLHTYDTVYAGSSISEYVDGRPVAYSYPPPATNPWTVGSHSTELQGTILAYAMRGGTISVGGVKIADPVPTFNQPGQYHDMIVRSVSFYENASANNAGSISTDGHLPLVAPGTTVTP